MSTLLYRVILPVSDIERAAAFYSELLERDGERVSPGRHYFDLGGVILAVYDPAADGDDVGSWHHHPNQYIYIGVDDLDAAFERAERLEAELRSHEIQSMPWGERLVYLRDPFGNPVCLVDNETLFRGSGSEAMGSDA